MPSSVIASREKSKDWIPAYAGMTGQWIPAYARKTGQWIPAYARKTGQWIRACAVMTVSGHSRIHLRHSRTPFRRSREGGNLFLR
jgi:hypothetical protein